MSNNDCIFFFLTIGVLFIIHIMALPNWGQLQKALDDPETIEQAIERLIAVHESDPEAHLGDGESLEAHKTAEVIDHPERSIPTDKYSTSEILLPILVSNDSAWQEESSLVIGTPGGLYLRNNRTDDNDSLVSGNIAPFPSDLSDFSFLVLDFQFAFLRNNRSDPIIIGLDVFEDDGDTIAFVFEDENVTGRLILNGTTTNTSSFDIDYESNTRFFGHARAVYDIASDELHFYLNDDLIGTLSPSSTISPVESFTVTMTRSADVDRRVELSLFSGFLSFGNY